jgi:hypothetical protein
MFISISPQPCPVELPAQAEGELQFPRRLAAVSRAQNSVSPNAIGIPRTIEHVEEIRIET